MSRLDDLKVLYTSAPPNNRARLFENIFPPCGILNLITIEDIIQLNQIAKSKKLSSRPVEKLNMIKEIMGRRGFRRLSSGTNRIVFKYMEDQSFVIKVAYDSVGLSDNLNELYNQELIKPFCAKVFEVSPCGTVGMFERVRAIKNREEFQSIAYDVFDIIVNEFVGKYVLADIGTKFFMNWGVRQGMFPVILDFPYIYELDGSKIYCNRPDPLSPYGFCGGDIDYDEGFNHLVCTKCGKTFLASELKLAAEKKSKDIIIEQEDIEMIVEIKRGDNVVTTIDSTKESETYRKDKNGRRKETPYEYRQRRKYKRDFKVEFGSTTVDVQEEPSQTITEKILSPTRPEQFNQGWGSKDVPSVDALYKNTSIELKGRESKDKKDPQPNFEAERVEKAISMAEQMTAAATAVQEEPPIRHEVAKSNEETSDPLGMAKAVLEIIIDDEDEETGDGEVEFPDYDDYATAGDDVAIPDDDDIADEY